MTTYQTGEQPARAVKISRSGSGRMLAYKMIPAWLFNMNLMEPCHDHALRRIGLERLRHTALVISKILAVEACLKALSDPTPPEWTKRLDRDLQDILYLTDRRLRSGLWCVASTAKRQELSGYLGPILQHLSTCADQRPSWLKPQSLERLHTVVDGLPLWWR
jgi:hypothetical protein